MERNTMETELRDELIAYIRKKYKALMGKGEMQ